MRLNNNLNSSINFLNLKKKIDEELNGLLGNHVKLETKLISLKNFLYV
jgi:hypothetical protein